MNRNPLIELRSVSCRRTDAGMQSSVRDVSLAVERDSVTVLTGCAGCGKNLLLGLMGLIEVPDSGDVIFQGCNTGHLTEDARADFRSHRCGYVFDVPFLLSSFSVLENIAMPAFKVSRIGPEAARQRTEDLLDFTGLAPYAAEHSLPAALQHRVALARALVNGPSVLFVQNLDTLFDVAHLADFRRLLHEVPARYAAAVVVTAGADFECAGGERRIGIADGSVLSDVSA